MTDLNSDARRPRCVGRGRLRLRGLFLRTQRPTPTLRGAPPLNVRAPRSIARARALTQHAMARNGEFQVRKAIQRAARVRSSLLLCTCWRAAAIHRARARADRARAATASATRRWLAPGSGAPVGGQLRQPAPARAAAVARRRCPMPDLGRVRPAPPPAWASIYLPVHLAFAFDVSGSMGKGDEPWHDKSAQVGSGRAGHAHLLRGRRPRPGCALRSRSSPPTATTTSAAPWSRTRSRTWR